MNFDNIDTPHKIESFHSEAERQRAIMIRLDAWKNVIGEPSDKTDIDRIFVGLKTVHNPLDQESYSRTRTDLSAFIDAVKDSLSLQLESMLQQTDTDFATKAREDFAKIFTFGQRKDTVPIASTVRME